MIHLPLQQGRVDDTYIADARSADIAECGTYEEAAHIVAIANAAWCLAMAHSGSAERWRACYAELLAAVRAATEEA